MSSIPSGSPRAREPAEQERSTDRNVEISRASEDVPPRLDLLSDEYTQEILAALSTGPRAGRELADSCSASRPTVYRRVNDLQEQGFVTTSMTLDPDGHHRKRFRLVRDHLTVSLDDGAITVSTRSADTRSS